MLSPHYYHRDSTAEEVMQLLSPCFYDVTCFAYSRQCSPSLAGLVILLPELEITLVS